MNYTGRIRDYTNNNISGYSKRQGRPRHTQYRHRLIHWCKRLSYNITVFDSREELTVWVSTTAKRLGFVLVTRRSRKNRAGIVTKVVFVCDRHGEYTGKCLLSSRATSTKKGGCPFELEGCYRGYDGWKVIVKNHNHNHSESWGLQGHAYARRMTEAEKEYVEELYALNLPVKDILSNLKQRFPENLSISNDIYNAIRGIKKKAEDEIGSSSMQEMGCAVKCVNRW